MQGIRQASCMSKSCLIILTMFSANTLEDQCLVFLIVNLFVHHNIIIRMVAGPIFGISVGLKVHFELALWPHRVIFYLFHYTMNKQKTYWGFSTKFLSLR